MEKMLVKEFRELDEKEKMEVLEKNRDINVEFYEWWDYILEGFMEDLKEKGLSVDPQSLSFDLYHRDIGIDYDLEDLEKFLEYYLDDNEVLFYSEVAYKIITDEDESEYTMNNISDFVSDLIHDEIVSAFSRDYIEEIPDLTKQVLSIEEDLNRELFNLLEESYDDQISDDAVIDTIEANEYLFDRCLNIVCRWEN